MDSTEFERLALAMIGRGFSPLPIAPDQRQSRDGRKVPEGKAPGYRRPDGTWALMTGWQRWCGEQVPEAMVRAWVDRMLGNAADAGIGVACGRSLICIDIDLEEAVAPLLAILPPSPVQKRGHKGISAFYRGDTEIIRSKNFRTPERVGLVDLLAEGKQTVLPPSVHPDTGEPYVWMTDDHLYDLCLEDLPELPEDIADKIGEVLRQFGYDPEGERQTTPLGVTTRYCGDVVASDGAAVFRVVNDAALASLSAWVPQLGLRRCYRAGGGFKAVAEWRSSGSGRDFSLRSPNLSFTSRGIRDFGDGRGYSPIDVVIAARGLSTSDALEWLAGCLGIQTHESDPVAEAMVERLTSSAYRKKISR